MYLFGLPAFLPHHQHVSYFQTLHCSPFDREKLNPQLSVKTPASTAVRKTTLQNKHGYTLKNIQTTLLYKLYSSSPPQCTCKEARVLFTRHIQKDKTRFAKMHVNFVISLHINHTDFLTLTLDLLTCESWLAASICCFGLNL